MKLKQYQTDTLSVLRRFFEEVRVAGPKGAYEAITKEPDQAKRLGRYGGTYTPLAELPAVPYVCLRLPTGGGKTILGAHSIGIARDAWVEKDYPMVLWLVPSNTIRLQTAEALKNAAPDGATLMRLQLQQRQKHQPLFEARAWCADEYLKKN